MNTELLYNTCTRHTFNTSVGEGGLGGGTRNFKIKKTFQTYFILLKHNDL